MTNLIVGQSAVDPSVLAAGPAAPGVIAAKIAAGVTAITANILAAKQTLSGATVPAHPSIGSGFKTGGYTGSGDPNEIAGFVHKNEYVVNADMLKDPDVFRYTQALEVQRLTGRKTTVENETTTSNTPSNINVSTTIDKQQIATMVEVLLSLKSTLDKGIEANVITTEENMQKLYAARTEQEKLYEIIGIIS
jgi:hypothetical protein